MALTDKDLTAIKDIVEFAIEKSEIKSGERFEGMDQRFDKIDQRFDHIDREIDDLIEINQAFLDKFDNHETRLRKVEVKLDMKTA